MTARLEVDAPYRNTRPLGCSVYALFYISDLPASSWRISFQPFSTCCEKQSLNRASFEGHLAKSGTALCT